MQGSLNIISQSSYKSTVLYTWVKYLLLLVIVVSSLINV
jgi:hypothetical protein